MAEIHLLEADDPNVGGVLFRFPSGKALTAHWKLGNDPVDPLGLAKECAAQILQRLLDEGLTADANDTNWASAAAACRMMIVKHLEKCGFASGGLEPAAMLPSLPPPTTPQVH
jgi:hypothetical protein